LRTKDDIEADFVKLKEAAYWSTRSGHTREQEIEQFDAAAKRLVNDFEGALLAYIAGDRDRLIKELEELRDSAVL
jgi:hypothetical protein